MTRTRRCVAAGLGLAVAAAMTGCLVENPNERGGVGGIGGVADGGSADGDGVVTVQGQFGGGEQAGLEAAFAPFEERTGIEVRYESVPDFTTVIQLNAGAGNSPDIGLFPQPGVLFDLAEAGHIQPVDTFLDYDAIDRTLVPGTLESARLNGRTFGAPFRLALKSLVFYPKQAYEQAGFDTAPETLQEMDRIAQQMGNTSPWCMGWEDSANTGWVGTDWVEELVLRMHGPDVYDQWVSHSIPFDDERIVATLQRFQEMMLEGGATYGGARGILSTPFGESFNPAFEDPPQCYWHRQGNFITGFLSDQIQENLDEEVGLFVFPRDAEGYDGLPVMGGGDIAALFNGNDEDAIEVMRYLTSDEFGAEWAAAGGYLSPHQTFDPDNYSDEVTRQIAGIVAEADAFRFDGSDLMPPAVGADAFWTGMVDLVNGASPQEVAEEIESRWPEDADD